MRALAFFLAPSALALVLIGIGAWVRRSDAPPRAWRHWSGR